MARQLDLQYPELHFCRHESEVYSDSVCDLKGYGEVLFCPSISKTGWSKRAAADLVATMYELGSERSSVAVRVGGSRRLAKLHRLRDKANDGSEVLRP